MRRTATWIYLGVIVGLALVAPASDYLKSSRAATATTAYGNANCSNANVCVADLDGNGLQQVIVGEFNQAVVGVGPTASYVNIINNTGTVRQQICWVNSNQLSASCPKIINIP